MPRYEVEPGQRILQALEKASPLGLTRAGICTQAHVCDKTAKKWIRTLESRGLIEECERRYKKRKVYRLSKEGT